MWLPSISTDKYCIVLTSSVSRNNILKTLKIQHKKEFNWNVEKGNENRKGGSRRRTRTDMLFKAQTCKMLLFLNLKKSPSKRCLRLNRRAEFGQEFAKSGSFEPGGEGRTRVVKPHLLLHHVAYTSKCNVTSLWKENEFGNQLNHTFGSNTL